MESGRAASWEPPARRAEAAQMEGTNRRVRLTAALVLPPSRGLAPSVLTCPCSPYSLEAATLAKNS